METAVEPEEDEAETEEDEEAVGLSTGWAWLFRAGPRTRGFFRLFGFSHNDGMFFFGFTLAL